MYKFKLRDIAKFFLIFVLAISPMLVSQLKFGATGINGISELLNSKQHNVNFINSWVFYINLLGTMMGNNLFPINISFGGIIGIIVTIYFFVKYFSIPFGQLLILFLFSSAWAAPFGGTATPFLNVGISFSLYLMVIIFIKDLFKSLPLLSFALTLLIITSNIFVILTNNHKGQTIFALQKDLNLKNETSLIEKIYDIQNGRPFSFNTITSPLYINTAWSYLFNWYGYNKYKYLPSWHGHDQIGLLGNNFKITDKSITDYYLIIDPPEPNFQKYIQPLINEENGKSTLVREFHFGQIILQQRRKI